MAVVILHLNKHSLNLLIMKALFFALLGCLSWVNVTAQDRQFKPFKVEIAGGVGVPTSGRVGYLLSLEPKYALNDQVTIGLRTESFVIFQKPFANLSTVGTLHIRSYSLSSDRYFKLGGQTRLSTGAAIGIYQYARGTANRDDYKSLTLNEFSSIKPGIAPRIGLELSHFRVGVEYNLVLQQADQNINYVSAKVGLLLGGGRYRNRY